MKVKTLIEKLNKCNPESEIQTLIFIFYEEHEQLVKDWRKICAIDEDKDKKIVTLITEEE